MEFHVKGYMRTAEQIMAWLVSYSDRPARLNICIHTHTFIYIYINTHTYIYITYTCAHTYTHKSGTSGLFF